ncbi:C2 domain-containing 2-like isoform X1 [Labeo rohita]|uniref:C2 domain-containing 2-like isoform X1 n=1 Tax=Labeo rohita TaxID=84645 RepID=A0A498LPM8_LABRO|nr:C2 domain-containing 2-like isoform X1 [Labeo rohita]
MVLQCNCSVDTITFPVTVTQQSPAAVSMDTYQITMKPMQAQGSDVEVDSDMIAALVEDTLYTTHPAMILNLRACVSSPAFPREKQIGGLNSPSQSTPVRRILVHQLKATNVKKGCQAHVGELCCVLNLDTPSIERRTGFLSPSPSPGAALHWTDDFTLEVGPETKELKVRLVEKNSKGEQFLPGCASLQLDLSKRIPNGHHKLSIAPGHGLAPTAVVTLELLYLESSDLRACQNATPLRSTVTPSKKVDVDRTIMPDGTIVTTVTTIQSRLKLDRKIEGTLPNGLDPVAETAIRQLTESAGKVPKKTPTKRSTLIISGVSKVPITEDDSALSVGYAAAMDAALQGAHSPSGAPNHHGASAHQETDETTPSDVSERPSVDDVDSETGSTGALETRSLKDHKVGFLRSGTKLLFRRKHREKDPSFSHSHEDISNLGNDSSTASCSSTSRKKSGSFSRRLIKRFSFRSSKTKGKSSTANGGSGTTDN